MANEFLLEIGVEELPARHCISILRQLNQEFIKHFADKFQLGFKNLKLMISPRRIAFYAEEIFISNEPVDGKQYSKMVSEFFETLLKNLHFPRPMRWKKNDFKFSRPIRWVVAIQGSKPLDLEVFGVKSSDISYGPRFEESQKIKIISSEGYKETLKKSGIIVDHEERRALIMNMFKKIEQDNLFTHQVCNDVSLVDEVLFLVENPAFLVCKFNERFLESNDGLPDAVIATILMRHQRYFPLVSSKDGTKLLNKYLVIANQKEVYSQIKKGHEKVVTARLTDGLFFYAQDLKKSLNDFIEMTRTIVFHEKLGSMYDKSARLVKFLELLSEHLDFDLKKAREAARLSKADLASQMVTEFPSLEGSMGKIYAIKKGIDREIADAIGHQYLPQYMQDDLPGTDLGTVLSLVDRLDSIFGLFLVGLKPKGRSDPYGVRRASYGVIRILWEKKFRIDLEILLEIAEKVYGSKANKDEIVQYLMDRLEEYVPSKLQKHLTRSILYNGQPILSDKKKTLLSVQNLSDKQDFKDFLEFAKRVYNITVKANITKVPMIKSEIMNESEKSLLDKVVELESKKDLNIEDLLSMTKPGNDFFEKNLVMSENNEERNNRVGILLKIYGLINKLINLKVFLHQKGC